MDIAQILLIEDNPTEQVIIKHYIEQNKLPYTLTIAGSVAEAHQTFKLKTFDIIISDLSLGDGSGFDILALAHQTPVIIITGTGNEVIAVEVMKAGAYNYLIKGSEYDYLKILPFAIESALNRKRAELRTQMMLHAIMNINESVYVTDLYGIIIFVNNALCTTYRYHEYELIGQPSIILSDRNYTRGKMTAKKIEPLIQGEYLQKRKDGTVFNGYISQSFITDNSGNARALAGVVHDLTAFKRAEEERCRREKMQGVLEMAGAACHELNQPLQAISGYSELLLMDVEEEHPIHTMLNEIKKEIDRMGTITRKLNNITHYETIEYSEGTTIIDIDKASK
jgi:PAS domain S-box-containing protein